MSTSSRTSLQRFEDACLLESVSTDRCWHEAIVSERVRSTCAAARRCCSDGRCDEVVRRRRRVECVEVGLLIRLELLLTSGSAELLRVRIRRHAGAGERGGGVSSWCGWCRRSCSSCVVPARVRSVCCELPQRTLQPAIRQRASVPRAGTLSTRNHAQRARDDPHRMQARTLTRWLQTMPPRGVRVQCANEARSNAVSKGAKCRLTFCAARREASGTY
jgi:hypothetical protein